MAIIIILDLFNLCIKIRRASNMSTIAATEGFLGNNAHMRKSLSKTSMILPNDLRPGHYIWHTLQSLKTFSTVLQLQV